MYILGLNKNYYVRHLGRHLSAATTDRVGIKCSIPLCVCPVLVGSFFRAGQDVVAALGKVLFRGDADEDGDRVAVVSAGHQPHGAGPAHDCQALHTNSYRRTID